MILPAVWFDDVAVADRRHSFDCPPHPEPDAVERLRVHQPFDDTEHDHRDRPESPDHIRGMTRAQALLLDAVCSTTARTDEAATVMVERLWPVVNIESGRAQPRLVPSRAAGNVRIPGVAGRERSDDRHLGRRCVRRVSHRDRNDRAHLTVMSPSSC
jgi:hypothetical protein